MKKILSIFAAMLVALTASAKTVSISAGDQTLATAVNWSVENGDTIVMGDGDYSEPYTIVINKNLVIKADDGKKPVVEMGGYFELRATAKFEGIKFIPKAGSEGYCMYFYENAHKYLWLENCEFANFSNFAITSWKEDYHIDSCIINNCYFHDLAKSPVYILPSKLEGNVDACDKLKVTNSTFANINVVDWVSVLDIRNNANNVTGATSVLDVDHCTFYNCQGTYDRMIQNYKSPLSTITNCIMMNPVIEGKTEIYATYLYGGSVHHNLNYQTKRQYGSGVTVTDSICRDPQFEDAPNGNYTLKASSPAIGKGTNGSTLGDPRWVPAAEEPVLPYMAIIGDMNNWAGTELVPAEDKLSASCTINLAMNDNKGYGFKVLVGDKAYCIQPGDSWYGFHRNWTSASGIDYVAAENDAFWLSIDKAGDYTFKWTMAEKKLEITFPDLENVTVYYVNKLNWEKVYAYAWDPKNAEWPGELATLTDQTYQGYNIWSYTLLENMSIIFNDGTGGDGHQTADLKLEEGKFIFFDGKWYAELEGVTTAIDNTNVAVKAQKVIVNGQLFIIRDGETFNAQGQIIR